MGVLKPAAPEGSADAIGAAVTINRPGIDKALSHAGDDILSAVPAIPDLIAHGERIATLPSNNPDQAKTTRAWHVLGGLVRIAGRDVPLRVHVREDLGGHFFYDMGGLDADNLPRVKAGDAEAAKGQSRISSAATRTSSASGGTYSREIQILATEVIVADEIPTYTITPNDPPQTGGPEKLSAAPSDASKRKPLTRDEAEKLVRKYNPDITRAGVRGEVDNILRESAGDPTKPGDQGTSAGLYQDHLTRLDGLKAFAAKEKADWQDPDIQVRYARLEKERDYPALLKFQQTTDDPEAANEQFKRVFERPDSVMWAHGPDGQPVTGSDKFQFSDYAMKDAKRRGGDDSIYYMSPGEYLDLSPELDGKPFDSPIIGLPIP